MRQHAKTSTASPLATNNNSGTNSQTSSTNTCANPDDLSSAVLSDPSMAPTVKTSNKTRARLSSKRVRHRKQPKPKTSSSTNTYDTDDPHSTSNIPTCANNPIFDTRKYRRHKARLDNKYNKPSKQPKIHWADR